MPGPSLPALLAVVAIGVAAVATVPDESAPTIGPTIGPAAAVRAPAPAAAAPHQVPPPLPGGRPGTASVPAPRPALVGAPLVAAAAAPRPGHDWLWPLSPTPRVGRRFDVGPRPWSPGHRGVDLLPAAGAGTAVLAAGPGVTRFAGVVAGRGVVSLDHGSGLRTTYEPVTASVRAGSVVEGGQVIGTLAEIGSHCDLAACLHWGATIDTRYVDPLALLRPREPPILLPIAASR